MKWRTLPEALHVFVERVGWSLSQSKKNKGVFGLPSTLDSISSFESSSRKFERLTILQVSLESLRKPRRQRQQKRQWIKGFLNSLLFLFALSFHLKRNYCKCDLSSGTKHFDGFCMDVVHFWLSLFYGDFISSVRSRTVTWLSLPPISTDENGSARGTCYLIRTRDMNCMSTDCYSSYTPTQTS